MQMTTPTDANVHTLAVNGTFDDCQALVKAMFNDSAFRQEVNLAGVNSINWARVMAQTTYYFTAAAQLGSLTRPSDFPCRPAISAIFLPDMSPRKWACPSPG